MKKFLSIILALTMCLSLGIVSFADSTTQQEKTLEQIQKLEEKLAFQEFKAELKNDKLEVNQVSQEIKLLSNQIKEKKLELKEANGKLTAGQKSVFLELSNLIAKFKIEISEAKLGLNELNVIREDFVMENSASALTSAEKIIDNLQSSLKSLEGTISSKLASL